MLEVTVVPLGWVVGDANERKHHLGPGPSVLVPHLEDVPPHPEPDGCTIKLAHIADNDERSTHRLTQSNNYQRKEPTARASPRIRHVGKPPCQRPTS